jgi:CRISPR-associated exonuclease Cas4
MYAENDLLPLSVLADLLFCERRTALHLIEGIWRDNLYTAEGTVLHSKVHDDLPLESRVDVRISRGLPLRSLRLGLSGKADVVEFRKANAPKAPVSDYMIGLPSAIALKGARGLWLPFPVDYKRGRLRHEEGFEVQLCAQALCLEEMMGVQVPAGAIYYGKPHRRLEVTFDSGLRNKTQSAAARLHELVGRGKTPLARYEKKCDSCSLVDVCLPRLMTEKRSVTRYLSRAVEK